MSDIGSTLSLHGNFLYSNTATSDSVILTSTGGAILAASVFSGASGYAVGDTGTIGFGGSQFGGTDSVYTVTAVGVGGTVTAFTFTPGTSYGVTSSAHGTTVTTGSGDGNFL